MDSLYRQTISSVVGNFKTLNGDWKCCPDKIVFDVVIKLYRKELFDLLTPILKDSQIFCRLLKARTNFHFYRSRSDHCLCLPSSAINSRSSATTSHLRRDCHLTNSQESSFLLFVQLSKLFLHIKDGRLQLRLK